MGRKSNYNESYKREAVVKAEASGNVSQTAADHGCNVICQKPYCENLSEAKALNAYIADAGVRLMVNENFRWQGWYRQIKSVIDAGHIGRPFVANLHMRQQVTMPTFDHGQAYFLDMPKLLLYEMGIHYLDTMRYLFGDPDTIYARLHKVNQALAGEDVINVMLGYPFMTITIQGSWASKTVPGIDYAHEPDQKPPPPPRFQIDGTEGTLVLQANGTLSLHRHDGDVQTWHFDRETRIRSRVATQQHFIDCLRSGELFETSGEETVKTMALVYAGYQSACAGQVVSPESLLEIV